MPNAKKILLNLEKLGIEKSRCVYFIPNKEDKLFKTCECGLMLEDHRDILKPNQDILNWSEDKCTAPDGITDGFGEILFYGKSEETSKYIRAYYKTEMEKMLKLFFDQSYWNLKPPKLLISITGGAKLSMSRTLRDVLCKGLVKVASTTNGWITTGGTNGGIMKHIGEAVKSLIHSKDKMVLLGICNWTTVINNHQLIKDLETIDNTPVTYEMINFKKGIKGAFLDPNHSHFVLVDNSKLNRFGGEISFRAELESELAKERKVPIVLVVVEGGPNTLDTISKSIEKNVPCVIIDKSGKISNILSDIYRYVNPEEDIDEEKNRKKFVPKQTNKNQEFKFETTYRTNLYNRVKEEFKDRKYDFDEIINQMEKMFDEKNRHLISIFELDSTKQISDLDEAILNAFSEVNQKPEMAELCLSWNRVDIARQSIFNDDFQEIMSSFENLMYNAILKNRVEFVHLLLENGFSLKKFLTYERLIKLYRDVNESSLLAALYRKMFKIESFRNLGDKLIEEKINFKNIGRIIQDLVKDLFRHEFTQFEFNNSDMIFEYDPRQTVPLNLDNSNDLKYKKFDNPEYHLFIFNILLGRLELSEIFWREGKNQLSTAIVATKILKSMAKKFDEDSELLIDMASKYESLACRALKLSNDLNEMSTQCLLIRGVKEFSGSTCLQIAKSAECLNFLSHPVCQNFLIKVWYHKIYPDTSYFRIFIGLIFPLTAPLFVYFGDKKNPKSVESDTPQYSKKSQTIKQIIPSKKTENIDSKDLQNKKKEHTYKLDFWNTQEVLGYFSRVKHFLKAPLVKFIYGQISYLMFLILFSYVLLCDFYPVYLKGNKSTEINTVISIPEIVLIIWIVTFTFEEIRQFFLNENRLMKAKVVSYFFDFQNMVEIFGLLFFFIAIILRFIPDYNCYSAARIILCFDILYWFYRSLYAYTFVKRLGPKLLMIRKMAVNLALFFLIILVFFFAFGISTQSLLYHNQTLNRTLLKNVFFPSYFVLVGDFYTRSTMMSADENCSSSDCPNYVGAQVSIAIYVIYIIFLNLLLINILIALFNKTYNQIQSESDPLWKFQKYSLVFEYFHKSLIPAPFIIFYYFFLFLRIIINYSIGFIFKEETINNNRFLKFLYEITKIHVPGFYYNFKNVDEEERIVKWESFIADELIFDIEKENNDQKNSKLQKNIEKLEILNYKYNIIAHYNKDANKKLQEAENRLEKIVDSLIGNTRDIKSPIKIDIEKSNLSDSNFNPKSNNKVTFKNNDKNLIPTSKNNLQRESSNVDKPRSSKSTNENKNDVSTDKPNDYNPVKFTAKNILTNSNADPDLLSYPANVRPVLEYNKFDKKFQVDRTSIINYKINDGLPVNPHGYTGVFGRGNLFYWGPNNAIEAIFTRFKLVQDEIYKTVSNQPVLEVIMYQKNENEFVLPHLLIGNTHYSDNITIRRLINKVFDENYLKENNSLLEKLSTLIQNSKHIDKYIPNSDLNTDNAWVEYFVVNYHDEDQNVLHDIPLKFDSEKKFVWKELSKNLEKKSDIHNQTNGHLMKISLIRNAFYE